MTAILDFLLHLDEKVFAIIRNFGATAYLIFFLIIFAETGLVILPFLPGDSLLFALGIFCNPNKQGLNVWVLIPLLVTAAFLGDNLNYQIGKRMGARIMANGGGRFFKVEHIERTQSFFAKHGGWTLVMARWVPIVRTFAPFVAGMGNMPFTTFLRFSFFGGLFWVASCVLLGYFFGQIKWVEDNFGIAMLVVLVASVIPILMKIRSHKKELAAQRAAETPPAA